jgi:hypothetical protein
MSNVIVASADNDPVTRALSSYALALVPNPQVMHLHNQAAPGIVSAISSNSSQYVFFFLHGRDNPPAVLDHLGAPVVEDTTIGLLASRTVCATCFSLNGLATHAANFNVTIVGYNGAMLIPLDQPYVQEMENAALAAHRQLLSGKTAPDAAAEARSRYMDVALRWYSQRTIPAMLYAASAQSNSQAIGSTP